MSLGSSVLFCLKCCTVTSTVLVFADAYIIQFVPRTILLRSSIKKSKSFKDEEPGARLHSSRPENYREDKLEDKLELPLSAGSNGTDTGLRYQSKNDSIYRWDSHHTLHLALGGACLAPIVAAPTIYFVYQLFVPIFNNSEVLSSLSSLPLAIIGGIVVSEFLLLPYFYFVAKDSSSHGDSTSELNELKRFLPVSLRVAALYDVVLNSCVSIFLSIGSINNADSTAIQSFSYIVGTAPAAILYLCFVHQLSLLYLKQQVSTPSLHPQVPGGAQNILGTGNLSRRHPHVVDLAMRVTGAASAFSLMLTTAVIDLDESSVFAAIGHCSSFMFVLNAVVYQLLVNSCFAENDSPILEPPIEFDTKDETIGDDNQTFILGRTGASRRFFEIYGNVSSNLKNFNSREWSTAGSCAFSVTWLLLRLFLNSPTFASPVISASFEVGFVALWSSYLSTFDDMFQSEVERPLEMI